MTTYYGIVNLYDQSPYGTGSGSSSCVAEVRVTDKWSISANTVTASCGVWCCCSLPYHAMTSIVSASCLVAMLVLG